MTFEVKILAAMRLAAVRHTGPYHLVGPAFHQLASIAGPAGLFARPGAMMVGLFKDDPATTAPESLRSAAGILVGETDVIPPGLVEERIPSGRYLGVLHVGPYEGLRDAYRRIQQELLPTTGHRRRLGASYEIYLNDPSQVSPDALKTEIGIPIE